MLGLIKISFGNNLDKELFLNLYKTLIRPLLEYCVQAWSPHFVKDINIIENVQIRATKLVGCYRNLDYDKRLEKLGLQRLQDRRKRGDMILTYRLLNGLEGIDYRKFFSLDEGHYNLRVNSRKITIPHVRLDVRKRFFSWRVIQDWNDLPDFIVTAPNISAFKSRYDLLEQSRLQARNNSNYVPR